MDGWKTAVEVTTSVKDCAEALGIVVGGIWAMVRFRKARVGAPRAELTHSLSVNRAVDGRIVLRLVVVVKNIGEAKVRFGKVRAWVCRFARSGDEKELASSDQRSARWRLLLEQGEEGHSVWECDAGGHFVEPGESEPFVFDVCATAETLREALGESTTVLVESSIENPAEGRVKALKAGGGTEKVPITWRARTVEALSWRGVVDEVKSRTVSIGGEMSQSGDGRGRCDQGPAPKAPQPGPAPATPQPVIPGETRQGPKPVSPKPG